MYDMVDGGASTRKSLLPKHSPAKRPNMVVPELGRGASYRADLTLYYDDYSLPIEVKWKSSSLNKENQILELKKSKGHLISLVKDSDPPDGITSSEIDFGNFLEWIARRSISLARDSASTYGRKEDRQYWLFSPRGSKKSSAVTNYRKMKKKAHGKRHFWAFKNHPENIRNHLRIRKGDRLLMLIQNVQGLKTGEAQSLKRDPKLPLNIFNWIEYEATVPYSIDLDDDRATFFESGDPPPGKRRWPHFINLREIKSGSDITLSSRDELAEHIVESDNRSGGPVNVSQYLFDTVISRLSSL